MQKVFSSIFTTIGNLLRSKIAISIVVLLVLAWGGYRFFHPRPTYQFVTVQDGSIVESVSLTGNTVPTKSVSLAFGSSGIISYTYSELGRRVHAGQVLAELNTSDLASGLRQAQANVGVQQALVAQGEASVASAMAKLEGLQAGARPEDIAASQAALDKAKQDLANMYGSISDASIDSYTKANDAVRTQVDIFFSNGDTQTPKLTYITANSQAESDAEAERLSATTILNAWQKQLASIGQSNTGLEALLQNEISYLETIRQLLNSLSKTLDLAPGLSASNLLIYKADVSVAVNEVNIATKNLNIISQNIASQKLTVSQLQAQLDLKRVGPLPADISAQQAQIKQAEANVSAEQAQVKQAQASVDGAMAKLQNAEIVAPIAGTITQFDAKVGQQASPSTPLISIMSSGGYEIDSGVSETDVGKISVDNKVTMTLDAFPGETFAGSVFYVAPSETNTQGVVSYQVKISFTKPDSRLKSGLTANIDIQTKRKDNVLILPQYAILQNDVGVFVETLENNKVKQNPVILGIQDLKGNVEVISGVTSGEQVLNIGLKS